MVQKLTLTGIILALAVVANAQSINLKGAVQDKESGKPVPKATLVLRSTADTTNSRSTLTDSSGKFSFDEVPKGKYQLRISSVGYEALQKSLTVVNSANLGTISINHSDKELEGVTIVAHIPPATQKGDTVEFNASQFKVNPDASAEDLAKKVPG